MPAILSEISGQFAWKDFRLWFCKINLPLYKLLRPHTENECQLNSIHIYIQVCWNDTSAYSLNYVDPTDIFGGTISH